MSNALYNVAFDCPDPSALARFWSQAMELPIGYDDGEEAVIEMPEGPNMYFQKVPEPKSGKNRLHVCLRPSQARELEVARLIGMGATLVSDHREPDGTGWVVLADPQGNEFCVLRSAAEREAGQLN